MERCACWAVHRVFQCLKSYRLSAKPPGLLQRSLTLKGRSSDRVVTVRSRYTQAYSLILLSNKGLLSVPGLSPSLYSVTRSTLHRTEKPEETDVKTTIAIIPITPYLVAKRGPLQNQYKCIHKISKIIYYKHNIVFVAHARTHATPPPPPHTHTHTHKHTGAQK